MQPLPLQFKEPTLTHFPGISLPLDNNWRQVKELSQVFTKADNASENQSHWDLRILPLLPKASASHLTIMRHWVLGLLCRRLFLEFKKYMVACHQAQWKLFRSDSLSDIRGVKIRTRSRTSIFVSRWKELSPLSLFQLDLAAGCQALIKFCSSSFFKRGLGSTLFFWRWPTLFQQQMRDGAIIFK